MNAIRTTAEAASAARATEMRDEIQANIDKCREALLEAFKLAIASNDQELRGLVGSAPMSLLGLSAAMAGGDRIPKTEWLAIVESSAQASWHWGAAVRAAGANPVEVAADAWELDLTLEPRWRDG